MYGLFFTLYCSSLADLTASTSDWHWHCSLASTVVFDHSFVDWKDSCFQRFQLIWSNIMGKHKNLLLLIRSQINVFSDYSSSFCNSAFLLLFLGVLLILKLHSCERTNNSRVSRNAVIKTWWPACFYSLLLLLSGDIELNPGPKRNSSNAFSFVFICVCFYLYNRNIPSF